MAQLKKKGKEAWRRSIAEKKVEKFGDGLADFQGCKARVFHCRLTEEEGSNRNPVLSFSEAKRLHSEF